MTESAVICHVNNGENLSIAIQRKNPRSADGDNIYTAVWPDSEFNRGGSRATVENV